ncbi:hypothetical protein VKT23_020715 [Stygiomarasmius scandens]|uniref:Uncharacterized protein n=1 Tax=Marasmiellus scandens TaxID=2682957 RepID=A0ABR1IIQ4_9AGAR
MSQLFTAKGIYSTWERLGDVSAALIYLQSTKKAMGNMIDTSYKQRIHNDADTTPLVWRVERKVLEDKLLEYCPRRNGFERSKAVVDILTTGYHKLRGSLANFNKNVRILYAEDSNDVVDLEYIDEVDDVGLQMDYGEIESELE